MLGGLGLGAEGTANLLNTISGLNGINPVWRKAERMVVLLKVCSRIEVRAERNSSLSKSEHPFRVARRLALHENACMVGSRQIQAVAKYV